MYKVSENYLEALSEKVYEDRISGTVTLKDGETIDVSDDNLVKNSLKITRELCGKEYRIGSFNLSCLKMAVFDPGALGRDYSNAVITLNYHLKLKDGGEERVPLGIYIADGGETSRKRDKVYITAYDGGIYFDREPSDSIRNMTRTPTELITAICEECGAELGEIAENLPNSEITVNISDKQIQTCRDAVMWCSALMCSYAVIDREGKLNIIPAKYSVEENGTTITESRSIGVSERNSIYSTDTRAYIKYLTAYCGDEVRQYASEYEASDEQAAAASYAMAKNPLLSGKSESECNQINEAWHKYIERFKQRGVTARIFGDPAIDVGDTIGFYGGDIDQRGRIIGVVTSYEWKYRNYHDIYCSAAECGERAASECITPSTKVRNQTEKRIDAIASAGSSPSPSSVLSAVSFEKNRLYYNGETYYVQFGKNRRIVCVTKGRKYAIMKSTDFTGSRIEAATAVMNGLTEDWDLEFDYFGGDSWGGQTTLSVSDIISGYSGEVEVDWGDGTVNNESVHSYSKGCYRVKMKLLGSIPERAYISTGNTRWGQDDNERYHNDRIGAVFYIGGAITWAHIYGNGYIQHYYFGESVRKVSGYCTGGSVTGGEMSCEVGVPPLVEEIGSEVFMYTSSEYIYIPESCTSIGDLAFYYNNASEIEIEEKGDPISVGRNCFGNTSSQFGFGMLDILRIPARVVYPSSNNISISYCCGLRALIYGRGITELNYLSYNDAPRAPGFIDSIKRPYFIFIPKTVTSIGNYLIPSDTDFPETNPVYIICEGNWLSITKDSDWDSSYGSRANVRIINDADWYNNPDKVIELLTRGG